MNKTQAKKVAKEFTKEIKAKKFFGYNGQHIVEVKTKQEALTEEDLNKLKKQGVETK